MAKDPYLLSSVNYALKILDVLSVKDSIGVSEIARILKMNRTSAFKLLYTLEHRDYVFKDNNAKYHLGVKFTNYAKIVADRHSFVDIAKIYMENINRICNETVCLASLSTNGKAIITSIIEGSGKDHMKARIGYEIDAYNNAVGKVLLSHLSADLQNSLVSQMKFIKKTPNSITSKEEFIKELNEIKNAPYCEQYEQFLFGHADIAVPVYDDTGSVISAIGIACTPNNLKDKHELIVKTLLDFSSMLSRKLGYYPNSTLTTSILSKK